MVIIAVEDELSGSDLLSVDLFVRAYVRASFGVLGYLLGACPASVRVSFSACVRVSVRDLSECLPAIFQGISWSVCCGIVIFLCAFCQ